MVYQTTSVKMQFSVYLDANDGSSSEILIDLADLDSGSPSPLKHVLTPPQLSDSLPADLLTLTSITGAQPSSSNTSSGSSSFQISPPSSQLPSSLSLLDEELGSLGIDGFTVFCNIWWLFYRNVFKFEAIFSILSTVSSKTIL